jgi:hypothetical protein
MMRFLRYGPNPLLMRSAAVVVLCGAAVAVGWVWQGWAGAIAAAFLSSAAVVGDRRKRST